MYWLVRATGTNRGFQGCVQLLSINGKIIDMRPWPLGKALSGADVGKCSCMGSSISNKTRVAFSPVEVEQWFRFERWKAQSSVLAWYFSVPLHNGFDESVVAGFITLCK